MWDPDPAGWGWQGGRDTQSEGVGGVLMKARVLTPQAPSGLLSLLDKPRGWPSSQVGVPSYSTDAAPQGGSWTNGQACSPPLPRLPRPPALRDPRSRVSFLQGHLRLQLSGAPAPQAARVPRGTWGAALSRALEERH